MIVVKTNSLSKHYHQGDSIVKALDGVSVNIKAGEFMALCGPSGSGKTTLLNMIGGLDIPTSGDIYVGDQNLALLSEGELSQLRLHKIGFVFQSYNLIPVLSAQENIEFIMQLQGVHPSVRSKRALEVLSQVGLDGMANRRPAELSGGQQQRVAVARAIAAKPSIVLADEPTANLDSKTAKDLLHLMKSLHDEFQITFIFSTHDPHVMEEAQRIIRLQDGKVVSDEDN